MFFWVRSRQQEPNNRGATPKSSAVNGSPVNHQALTLVTYFCKIWFWDEDRAKIKKIQTPQKKESRGGRGAHIFGVTRRKSWPLLESPPSSDAPPPLLSSPHTNRLNYLILNINIFFWGTFCSMRVVEITSIYWIFFVVGGRHVDNQPTFSLT